MKVSFPQMGSLTLPISYMLQDLNIEVANPPPITKRTVELGSLHSPEGACLPYKITLGTYLESLEQGADTLISLCGGGKCRFGLYGALQKIALEKRQKVSFYHLNSEHLLHELYHFLCKVSPLANRLKIIRSIALAVKKLQALDLCTQAKNFYGSRTASPDKILSLHAYGVGELASCDSFGEISNIHELITTVMQSYSDELVSPPVKIALVGEFYVLAEPYVNHRIEDLLIRHGVDVRKFVYTGDWAYSKLFLQAIGLYNEEKDRLAAARPYLHSHIGGEGLKSVATALYSARSGYDGIIHLFPLGCMPEVVAQYAVKNIGSDYNTPLLSLSLDEHSSDIGMLTRIEAFVDCIARKKHLQ